VSEVVRSRREIKGSGYAGGNCGSPDSRRKVYHNVNFHTRLTAVNAISDDWRSLIAHSRGISPKLHGDGG
jgi:hypothetical protein